MNKPLTPLEMQVVVDKELILTKNRIIQNVQTLFGSVAEVYKKEADHWMRKVAAAFTNAKISRGENYQGLPYVVLDYPRQFGKADVLAIRTFFWWGNFFSITLHLQGIYQHQYKNAIAGSIASGILNNWYIAISGSQWDHHFDDTSHNAIQQNNNYPLEAMPFLKLVKKIPLTKWDEAETFFIENFTLLIKTLAAYAPIL